MKDRKEWMAAEKGNLIPADIVIASEQTKASSYKVIHKNTRGSANLMIGSSARVSKNRKMTSQLHPPRPDPTPTTTSPRNAKGHCHMELCDQHHKMSPKL